MRTFGSLNRFFLFSILNVVLDSSANHGANAHLKIYISPNSQSSKFRYHPQEINRKVAAGVILCTTSADDCGFCVHSSQNPLSQHTLIDSRQRTKLRGCHENYMAASTCLSRQSLDRVTCIYNEMNLFNSICIAGN